MDYYEKYIKYKLKYIELKKLIGGSSTLFIRIFTPRNELIGNLKLEYPSFKEITIQQIIGDIKDVLYCGTILNPTYFSDKYGAFFILPSSQKHKFDENLYRTLADYDIHNNETFRIVLNTDLICNKELLEREEKFKEYKKIIGYVTNDDEKFKEYFSKLDQDTLFLYIKNNVNREDHNKILLYYIARFGKIELFSYLIDRLGVNRIKELLKIRAADGRTVLYGAINAINNRKKMYTSVKDLTDPSLYKVTFKHLGEDKNMKDWFEIRNYHKSTDPEDIYIYNDLINIFT